MRDFLFKEIESLANNIISNDVDSIIRYIASSIGDSSSWAEENIKMRKERFLMKQKGVIVNGKIARYDQQIRVWNLYC